MRLVVTSRRAFLQSAAASLALPFLPSLARAQAAPPLRLAFFYVPNGIHMPAWTPVLTGEAYDLPYILEPLAPIQSKVSVLTGLDNVAAIYPVNGDHARGTGTFLTCSPLPEPQEPILNGISADQIAAQTVGTATPFPSLELGLEGGATTGDCDSGYSCAYVRSIAWSGPRTPLPKVTDAKLEMYALTPEQQHALEHLAAGLCALFPQLLPVAPRDARGRVLDRVLTPDEFASFRGVLGHYHVTEEKVDPGPAFEWEALLARVRALMPNRFATWQATPSCD